MELVKQFEEIEKAFGPHIARKKKTFDFTKIYISCVEKKIAKLIDKNISLAMELNNFDYEPPIENCPKKLSQRLIMDNKIMKEELKEWEFITINPKPEISLEDFHKKIKSLTKWIIFKKGFYVLEQRGSHKDELGKGMHAHIMLVKYTIEHKRLIKRLETTFSKFCDLSTDKEEKVNVRRKSPEHGRETLNKYMNGEKQEDKLNKVEMDKIWRKENNLDEIYFWDTSTTDKSIPKKAPSDGRVNNGGKREGSGRKKKVQDEIGWGECVTIENKNIELSF